MDENEIKFSQHVEQRIVERKLEKKWIIDTVKSPVKTVEKSEKEIHSHNNTQSFRVLKIESIQNLFLV